MHWLAAAQACPLGLSAQFLVVPDPWQVNGATQSLSALQLVLQALVPQTKLLGQADEVGGAQVPAPVQWETGVNVDPVQEAVPHATPVPPCWQWPAPSQAPVLPHGGAAAHPPCGSVVLAATLAQLPALPATLQAWQVGQDPVLQQTPSTQLLPVKHSAVEAQA